MMPFVRQKGVQSRKLLCFSAAFFLAAAGFSLLTGAFDDAFSALWLTLCLCFGICGAMVALLRDKVFSLAAVLMGAVFGGVWCFCYTMLVYCPAVLLDGQAGTLRVELTEYAESRTSYGLAYGVLTELDGSVCRHAVRVYLEDGSPDYAPGDVLIFPGTLRRANSDYRAALLQKGCFLTVRQEGEETCLPAGRMTLLRRARILSHDLGARLMRLLPGEDGALLAAMLCGDKSGLTQDLTRALNVSGTRHITAVSGLHISILAGMMIRLFGKRKGLLAAIPAAAVYAAMVGFPASVLRAFVFLLFWSASFWLKEERDPLTTLGAALLLLLLPNPFSALSASLLLSFSATLGLILLTPPLSGALHTPLEKVKQKVLRGILHSIAATIASSAAAILFTLPVSMLFFDAVPLAGVLSNVLILWAAALVMELGILLLAVSAVWWPAAAFLAKWVVCWPLRWMVLVIRTIGGWRFAAGDAENLYLALFGLLTMTLLLLWKRRKMQGKTAVAFAMTLLLAAVAFTAGERLIFGEIEVRSSGGQAVTLIRGATVSMVNAGAQSETAEQALEDALIRWNAAGTDTVLCTSAQYRTQGGLAAVLREHTPQRVILPAHSGKISEAYAGQAVTVYRGEGSVIVSGMSVELFSVDEDLYACRLVSPHVSLLNVCGLKPEQITAVLAAHPCRAQYLLLDARLIDDPTALRDALETVKPDKLLLADGGYQSYEKEYDGIPLVLVGYDGVRIRYVR